VLLDIQAYIMHDRPGGYIICKPVVNCVDWDKRSFSVDFLFSWKSTEYAAVLNSDVDHVVFVLLEAIRRRAHSVQIQPRSKNQARPRPCTYSVTDITM
jgi:hypothetical protein